MSSSLVIKYHHALKVEPELGNSGSMKHTVAEQLIPRTRRGHLGK